MAIQGFKTPKKRGRKNISVYLKPAATNPDARPTSGSRRERQINTLQP